MNVEMKLTLSAVRVRPRLRVLHLLLGHRPLPAVHGLQAGGRRRGVRPVLDQRRDFLKKQISILFTCGGKYEFFSLSDRLRLRGD